MGTHDCHMNAECTNTDGSYNCTCNRGYEGDGVNCASKLYVYYCDFIAVHSFGLPLSIDINECERDLDNCALNAACTDTIGNFTCACTIGYSGDGVSCGKCSLPIIYCTTVIWTFS